MPIKFHDHNRVLRRRFLLIFIGSFVLIFSIFNIRYLYANIRYMMLPGTIETRDTTPAKPLPVAADVRFKPLSDHANLIIDSLGINAPIVFGIPSNPDNIYNALEDGVVHYSDTVKPGMRGASVVLGHSSAYPWYKGNYGSVFALLSKLKVGDRFYVRYDDGRYFIFQVKDSLIFNPLSNDSRVSKLEQTDLPSLILVSCYPVGTNYLRIAIRADLVTQ